MKVNIIVHIVIIAFINGVIGIDSLVGNNNDGIIINGQNVTDIPGANTVSTTPDTTPEPTTTPTTTTTTTTTAKPTTKSTTPIPAPTTTTPAATTSALPTKVSTTTEGTTSAPTQAPSHKGRRFDGPSFIGGIILASGLMAIGFVSWKFYKARTERNYHTL